MTASTCPAGLAASAVKIRSHPTIHNTCIPKAEGKCLGWCTFSKTSWNAKCTFRDCTGCLECDGGCFYAAVSELSMPASDESVQCTHCCLFAFIEKYFRSDAKQWVSFHNSNCIPYRLAYIHNNGEHTKTKRQMFRLVHCQQNIMGNQVPTRRVYRMPQMRW